MGIFRSDLFKDDPKLEASAVTPRAHLLIGSPPGRTLQRSKRR